MTKYLDQALLIAQGKGRYLPERAHVAAVVQQLQQIDRRNHALTRLLMAVLRQRGGDRTEISVAELQALELEQVGLNIVEGEHGAVQIVLTTPQLAGRT